MPWAMGIRTTVSAELIASAESPGPSDPSTMASRACSSARKSRIETASGVSASAATWKPASARAARVSGHSPVRVHGTCSTVPMLTRMARR